jgi:hypothetical protein
LELLEAKSAVLLTGVPKMEKRLVSTGSFVATDGSGERYLLEVFTEFEDVVRAGYFRSVAGIKRIKTPLGQDVDLIEGGRYQISETSIVVTSDDPLSP